MAGYHPALHLTMPETECQEPRVLTPMCFCLFLWENQQMNEKVSVCLCRKQTDCDGPGCFNRSKTEPVPVRLRSCLLSEHSGARAAPGPPLGRADRSVGSLLPGHWWLYFEVAVFARGAAGLLKTHNP